MAGLSSVQNKTVEEGQTRVLRIYADGRGYSHMEELEVAMTAGKRGRSAKDIPVTGMILREYTPGVVDWHTAPARQFAITIAGELEVEVSDGARRRVLAGELVFLEDTEGRGHVTGLLCPVTNLYIQVPAGFDVVAWSRGEG
jgi:hypothetical protein